VAIDGPAAAGKTTVAEALAARLGALFFDTGLLYRAATLLTLRAGIDPADGPAVSTHLRSRDIAIEPPTVPDGRTSDVLIDGEDVTPLLRTPEIDRHVSAVSAHPVVRDELLPIQRRIAGRGRVVMVGRDIATVVVPDAGVKVFLDASDEERARRRHRELVSRGLDVPLDHVLAELRRRDAADAGRDASPLRRAQDAVVVDSDGKSIDQVTEEIARIAERAWAA
jgi:cytidylate kinase